MVESVGVAYLPVRPVVLGEHRVKGVRCPVCHQHDGLTAHAPVSSLVKLKQQGTWGYSICMTVQTVIYLFRQTED